jgi:hypothetical protein
MAFSHGERLARGITFRHCARLGEFRGRWLSGSAVTGVVSVCEKGFFGST